MPGPHKPNVFDPVPGAPTPMGAVRGCWPTADETAAFARLERRMQVADTSVRMLQTLGADVYSTGYEDLPMHGPALPTASQGWTDYGFGFGRYSGPWITTSGFRVPDGPHPTRTIPNAADLRRAGR